MVVIHLRCKGQEARASNLSRFVFGILKFCVYYTVYCFVTTELSYAGELTGPLASEKYVTTF